MTQATLQIPSVTGVDHTLRIAGPGARSYAFVVDWHIRALAALAWFLVAMIAFAGDFDALLAGGNSAAFSLVVVMPSLAIYFLYHPVVEIAMHGRTPGKRIAGVRLLRLDGGVPTAMALLIRNVFRLIDSLPFIYALGLATTILTRENVRIGDMAGGTILVYDDAIDSVLTEISGEAIGRLGLERAELVRDLLARWSELDPNVRVRLGRRVLEGLGPDLEPEPGGSVHGALEALLR